MGNTLEEFLEAPSIKATTYEVWRRQASVGVKKLTRIEVTRSYTPWDPKITPGTIFEPGKQTYGSGQRNFLMGWEIAFKSGRAPQGRCHATAQVDITQLPATVTSGSPATFAASMRGEWQMVGFGLERDHTIKLSGAVGEKKWSIVDHPDGNYNGSITTSNTFTVPGAGGSELGFDINARLSFGGDNWGEMTIHLVYTESSAKVIARRGSGNELSSASGRWSGSWTNTRARKATPQSTSMSKTGLSLRATRTAGRLRTVIDRATCRPGSTAIRTTDVVITKYS